MGSRLKRRPSGVDIFRKEVGILLPELPEQMSIAIGALFDFGQIFNSALNNEVDLFRFFFIHPDLSSSVTDAN